VKGLASNGITVCATIHSPTPYCFGLFDRVLLLLRGNVVYFGANGELSWLVLHVLHAVHVRVLPVLRAVHVRVLPVLPAACNAHTWLASCLGCLLAGAPALEYFQTRCPSLPGLKEGENAAEWIVDLTTQASFLLCCAVLCCAVLCVVVCAALRSLAGWLAGWLAGCVTARAFTKSAN